MSDIDDWSLCSESASTAESVGSCVRGANVGFTTRFGVGAAVSAGALDGVGARVMRTGGTGVCTIGGVGACVAAAVVCLVVVVGSGVGTGVPTVRDAIPRIEKQKQ